MRTEEEIKKYQKVYREANKEKAKKYKQAYYKLNKESIKAYREDHKDDIQKQQKAYRDKNKCKRALQYKVWIEKNKEHRRQTMKKWRENNTEKRKIYIRQYRLDHSESVKKYQRKRRALKSGANYESYKDIDVYERDNWVCGICGTKINRRLKYPNPRSKSIDHIVPLSRDGADVVINLQSAHLRCNLSKGNHYSKQLKLVC